MDTWVTRPLPQDSVQVYEWFSTRIACRLLSLQANLTTVNTS